MHDASELDPARLIASEDDRRAFRRIPLHLLAHVRLPGPLPLLSMSDSATEVDEALYAPQAVLINDLSMTGLFFSSALVYPVGAEMEISLTLNKLPFVVFGTVARRTRADNRTFGYGINFLQSRAPKEFRIALAAALLRQDCAVPAPKVIVATAGRR